MKTKSKALTVISDYKAVFLLIALIIIGGCSSDKFLSVKNATNILQQIAPNGIVAVGLTLVAITGGFDMSVGSVMSLTGVIMMMALKAEMPLPVAIFLGLLIGIATGFLNGILVAAVGINPFITTLATQILVKGIALGITDTYPVKVWNNTLAQFSLGKLGFMPYAFIVVIVEAAIYQIFLKRTRAGHNIYVCGSNQEAGWSAGINITKTLVIAYTICGFSASIGGVFLASKLGAGSPVAGGDAALLTMTAFIIGGNSISGSKANMLKTIIGVLILGIMNNVMNMMGTMSYLQTMIRGLIVIIVIAMDAEGVKRYLEKIRGLKKV